MIDYIFAECPEHGAYMAHNKVCPRCELSSVTWDESATSDSVNWPSKTTDGKGYAAVYTVPRIVIEDNKPFEFEPIHESLARIKVSYSKNDISQDFKDTVAGITRFTVYGEPIPKARARFGVGKTYDPEKNRNYKKLIQDTLDSIGTFYEKDIQLGVVMLFYRKNNVKADTDNLTKAIFDACNKKLWDDDKQIRASYSEVHYADKNPRAEIIVCSIIHFRDELKALLDKLGQ